MASAGQAHAHSSQPMHFSSPSGHLFSWCLPWKRGAVGRFSSGYWTVSTLLNICRKVTAKPLTGLRKSSTGDLLHLGVGPGGVRTRQAGRRPGADAVVVRQVHRRHREGPAVLLDGLGLGELVRLRLALGGDVPGE